MAPQISHPQAHVVIVFHGLHICGAARHCLELLKYFRAKRVYTTVVAPYGGGQWADRFIDSSNEIVVYTDPSTNGDELAELTWRSNRRILSLHYDYSIAWGLAAHLEVETYAHFHTEPEFGHFTRSTLSLAGAHCRRILFPSRTTMRAYSNLFTREPIWWQERARVLPNVIFPEGEKTENSGRLNNRPHKNRLGIVSRLDADKLSIPLLIETLQRLRAVIPDVEVRIAGDGLIGRAVRQEITRAGLGDNVSFLGWVENVACLYAWADATFLPSHSETMPYAVLESVAAGCPVALPALGRFAEAEGLSALIEIFDPSGPGEGLNAVLRALAYRGDGKNRAAVAIRRPGDLQLHELYRL